ncbi:MAG: dTMP kinase [Candidatus Omnitrophica bacterium]|nr:dTMP kinase [Candidatus Omnitrophota bacterium]
MEKNDIKKSRFITIEGLEGCGKSSVINYLNSMLLDRGYSVEVFREPGSTSLGERIRHLLLDKTNTEMSYHIELLLYLAARTQLIEQELKAAFNEFDIVICDRFFDSTIAYQGFGCQLGALAEKAAAMFNLGVIPDLTLFLDVPVVKGLARIDEKDRIESREISFHERIRQGYLHIAKKDHKRVKVVDADCTLDELYFRVNMVITEFLEGQGLIP